MHDDLIKTFSPAVRKVWVDWPLPYDERDKARGAPSPVEVVIYKLVLKARNEVYCDLVNQKIQSQETRRTRFLRFIKWLPKLRVYDPKNSMDVSLAVNILTQKSL